MVKRVTYTDRMTAFLNKMPMTDITAVAAGLAMLADAIYETSDAAVAHIVGPRGTQFKADEIEMEDDDG